jgi:hypothetical protein
MECVYCLSPVDDKANVCKVCTRDLYLFRPLLEKVQALETKLADYQDPVELKARVEELEGLLAAEQTRHEESQATSWRLFLDVGQFIFIPLALLLLAHALITVVYDINMLYLRIASVLLPMPFGFYLFKGKKRSIFGWFVATAGLAVASVIGMSAITGWIDQTPVMPQSLVEWREFLEYAASITFSFLTGMLLGGMAYHRAHRVRRTKDAPFLTALVTGFTKGKSSPKDIHETIKKLEEMGGSLIAAGTTAMSIYTGLKAFM